MKSTRSLTIAAAVTLGWLGGMATMTLNRIAITGSTAKSAERWSVGHRIRDVEVAADGTLWMLEDDATGGLWHVTPK